MAGKTRKLGIFGPDIFFVEAFAFGAPCQAIHFAAKLDGLACAPIADADPGSVLDGFPRGGLARGFPVSRHYGRKGIQFEDEIRVAGGNHFVVDKFFFGAEMAAEAFVGAMDNVARVVHAEAEGLFVGPVARGVRAEPCGGWAVAIFAGDPVG